jgi:hypothetical protein
MGAADAGTATMKYVAPVRFELLFSFSGQRVAFDPVEVSKVHE